MPVAPKLYRESHRAEMATVRIEDHEPHRTKWGTIIRLYLNRTKIGAARLINDGYGSPSPILNG